MQVMPHLALGRCSPPELCHAQRLPVVLVGVLQQFGGAAVAGSCGRCVACGVLKNLGQRAVLAQGVHHTVLVEEPALQGVRALAALLFQACHPVGVGCHLLHHLLLLLSVPCFHSFQLCLLVLALFDKLLQLWLAGGGSELMTPFSVVFHLPAVVLFLCAVLLLHVLQLAAQLVVGSILLHALNGMVYL